MSTLERWVCWNVRQKEAYLFSSFELAQDWLKSPMRGRGWHISPVYADG
jgi:hypothetical protein